LLSPCSGEACLGWPQPCYNLSRKGGGKPPHSKKCGTFDEVLAQQPNQSDRRCVGRKIRCRSRVLQVFQSHHRPNRWVLWKTIAVMSSCRARRLKKIALRQRENRATHRRICIGTDSKIGTTIACFCDLHECHQVGFSGAPSRAQHYRTSAASAKIPGISSRRT
jgi:hypothetical protein